MRLIVKIRSKAEVHHQLSQAELAVGAIVERCSQEPHSDLIEVKVNRSSILLDKRVAASIYVEAS
jgi:Fe2+ transport system protein FeoA